jgi:16S rRNA C1402 (ribose-2'-O) methylase RsmI
MEKLCDQLISLGFVGKISIARELSKMYEQYWCDDIHATHQAIKNGTIPLKGEFVVGLWADKK